MNKDVVYVEPENDITDIITKIENSPEKIVVLVPPKKAGVFRSVVNIKLIARAGRTAEKTVVLVTVDPSIVKLAAAAKIPVTKDLKTPPEVPELEEDPEELANEEIVEEFNGGEDEDEVVENPVENSDSTPDDEEMDEEPAEDKKTSKKAEKAAKKADKKAKNKSGGFMGWVKGHKAPVAIGGVLGVVLIAFLVWAFGFAPSVSVAVEIQTESRNFAENVSFTTTATDENAKDGLFYIQEKKEESVQEIKFDATGKKNVGEKASGTATVYAYLSASQPRVPIESGRTINIQGKSFVVTEGTTLSITSEDQKCDNAGGNAIEQMKGCKVQGNIHIEASEPGSQYNISWNNAEIGIADATMSGSTSGGTDKEVKIVEQIDVEKAKDQVKASNEEEIKKKLMAAVGDKMMAIESSYNIETGNAEANPAVGQEVADGTQPTLKVTTTATIYAVDKTKLEEFIDEKAEIPDDQKVYQITNPYIENFTGGNGSFTGRLKAGYEVGPKVTESEVIDKIKGKGLGDAQHELKAITGVVNVTIDKSYPWVMSVPGDSNKITVNLEVKDNNNAQNNNGGETEENGGNK